MNLRGKFTKLAKNLDRACGHKGFRILSIISLVSTVEIDPPGRGAPDIIGKHSDGSILVGEIKSATEAKSSASNWWSYWGKPERDLRIHYRHYQDYTS